jgi:chromosome segregation ATPase
LPNIEELEELVKKFEDRVKVVGLMNEKRFAETELKIGELNQKLNELTTDFPKLKERAAEIEDLLNIINLGLSEYKDDLEKIDSNVCKYEKIPETLEVVRTNLEAKMKELNDSVSNLTTNVEVLKNLKDDVIKNAEESISSKFKTIGGDIEKNKVELEHVKRDLDGFSVALRSFERTIELTNLDDIIRRFDSLDRRIVNNELELEKFRGLVPDVSVTIIDVEIIKKKIKEMSSSVMDVLSRMNEFEINLSRKMSLFEDLIKKAEAADENVKNQNFKLEETKFAVERIYNELNAKVSGITNVNEDVNKLKLGIEDIKSDVGRIYNELSEKVSGITNVNEDVNKLKLDVEELKISKPNLDEMVTNIKNEVMTEVKSQLPADQGMRIDKIEEQVNSLSSANFDKTIENLREKINELSKQDLDKTNKLEYESLKDKIEDIEKSIIDINKSKFDYQKTDVQPRVLKVDNVIKEVPKNITDEIISLKKIVSSFSSENNDLRRIIRDVRLNQMDSINSDVFVGFAARVSTIEKKLSEIEEELSKMRKNQ